MSDAAPRKPLVLVVDDQQGSRDLLVRMLESGHFRGVAADGPRQAQELIARERPDVIITDLSMPDVDGWSFIEQIKGDEHTAAIPIVVVTAHVQEMYKVRALAAGATFFPKPFKLSELLAEMNDLIYGDRSHDRHSTERG